jgi:hypothetical protein
MSDLHDMNALRLAPRTASPLVLWVLCAVALGGIRLLHEGASQVPAVSIASTPDASDAAVDNVTRPAVAKSPALAPAAVTD